MRSTSCRRLGFFLTAAVLASLPIIAAAQQPSVLAADTDPGIEDRLSHRLAAALVPAIGTGGVPFGAMTPAKRRAAVDAVWGPGLGTATNLEIFDKFWNYADAKFAAFQGIEVDWAALRDRYRPEVARGVSRGRFAAIMNHMSLALREGHTVAFDILVNLSTLPQPGVPLFGVGAWVFDTSGACLTAQDHGSALVYAAISPHPLGLQPGDRILGYDGRPWRELYQQLIKEELPMFPFRWGSGPEGFEHTFVMSAGMNWHLFNTMDVFKHATGTVARIPTSLMPGAIPVGLCSEQLPIPGVAIPDFFAGERVRWGVIDGTRIGYIYVMNWSDPTPAQFAEAVRDLTQVRKVDGLILDFRLNLGGLIRGPSSGLAALFKHPDNTLGLDERRRPDDHFKMKRFPHSHVLFRTDLDFDFLRDKAFYGGPIAVLVGPGASSAGDFGAVAASYHPRARLFGKTTAMAIGLPTQPALGTELNLHPEWFGAVIELNTHRIEAKHDYLIHTDLVVDERVWLRPADVAAGRDTVVDAALRWLKQQVAQGK